MTVDREEFQRRYGYQLVGGIFSKDGNSAVVLCYDNGRVVTGYEHWLVGTWESSTNQITMPSPFPATRQGFYEACMCFVTQSSRFAVPYNSWGEQ